MSILLGRSITSGSGKVQLRQLDSTVQATIEITNDDTITNNVEASYASSNLLIKYKTGATLNQLAAEINASVPSDFSAHVWYQGGKLLPALTQTNFEEYLVVPHEDTLNDLSSLTNIHTVTRTEDNSNIVTYSTYNRLIVEGTLFHDPENEILIIRNSGNGTSLSVNMNSNFIDGGNNWRTPPSWSSDSEGRTVIELLNAQDALGNTYVPGDAIEFRGNSTFTGGTEDQQNRLDKLYRHCHRVMEVNGDFITTSFKNPYDGTVSISGGQVIRRACYNYGREETVDGRTRYSSGTGFISTGDSATLYNPSEASLSNSSDGLIYARGGTFMLARPGSLSKNVDIDGTTFVGLRPGLQIRSVNGWIKNAKFVNISLSNYETSSFAYELGITLENATLIGVLRGSLYENTLRDFDVSTNTAATDIGADTRSDQGHVITEVINSANGSNIRHMWRTTDGRNGTAQPGVCIVKKEVSLNIKDVSGNPIEGVEMYLQDNPSSAARDGLIVNTNKDFADTTITAARAEYDSVTGGLRYLYADPIAYTSTTDSNGYIDTLTITTASQVFEYRSDEPAAMTTNGGPYNIPSFSGGQWREQDGLAPAYSDWDTDRFGGFYKVDRRSDSNTDADDFTFKFCSYDHSLSSSTQALKGVGELVVNWVLFEDQLITDPRAGAGGTDSYTVIDTAEKFYNKAKAYLVDNYAGETETLVSRSGTTLDAGDNNIVLDPSAATALDLTDATFSTFSGVFITAATNNPASQNVAITANTAGNVTIEIVGNDTDTVATLAAAQGATATGDGASEVLASGDSNKITVTGGSNPIITIKCISFAGNLTTTETITVNSGVTVLGTITDVNNPSGLSSRSFSISNVILGTTIQIYNETQVTKRGTAENYSPANVYETLIASGTTISSTLIGDGTSTIAQLIATQSLTADPMADTSYVLPSGWVLTTTEVASDNNRVTISGIYDEGTVPNGDFNVGDSARIRATCAAAAGAFLPFVNTTIANEGGFSIRVNQLSDTIYNDNNIDGSAANFDNGTLTLTNDYANLQIDVSDTDNPGQVTVQEIYAKYAYLITTTDGIEHFFGAMIAENASNYKINVDVIDLKIQNISASDMIITGARLYRSNSTTIIEKGYLNNDVANGPAGTLSHDTGELVQFIRPQVESAIDLKDVATSTGVNAVKADTEAVKKKTNLIPGLL